MLPLMDLCFFVSHFREHFPHLIGGRVLVAFSGGADSTALLHLLRHRELRLDLCALHIHHGLRGEEADADAGFCRRYCENLGVPLEILRPMPEKNSGSLEADWRELRYRAFRRIREKTGALCVATGHHRDDIAEGVLLQLLRGGSLRSMAGIHSSRSGVIRPLLPFSHRQLLDWLAERGISWVRDSSNLDTAHLRNRVRHEVLPFLEGIAPSIRRQLLALSSQIADVEAWAGEELRERVMRDLVKL